MSHLEDAPAFLPAEMQSPDINFTSRLHKESNYRSELVAQLDAVNTTPQYADSGIRRTGTVQYSSVHSLVLIESDGVLDTCIIS